VRSLGAAILAVFALLACGSPRAAPVAAPPQATAAPDVMPTPAIAAPAPVIAVPEAPPGQMSVGLGPLAPGTYTVHLHTICNGGPAFHITTIGFVQASRPALTLTSGDLGRGWCLVVYTDPSATRVVTYRPI